VTAADPFSTCPEKIIVTGINAAGQQESMAVWREVEPTAGLEPATCGLRNRTGGLSYGLLSGDTEPHRKGKTPRQH
jgi:hypothetical protein